MIGHPFSARRYANGSAQGKWALGIVKEVSEQTENSFPIPHSPFPISVQNYWYRDGIWI
jgi:hypothetical protein